MLTVCSSEVINNLEDEICFINSFEINEFIKKLGSESEIIYINYWTTGIKVSKIGMGCMRFPEDYIRQRKTEKCIELVRYAYSKGINLYDVAPFYCHDLCELIVGEALTVFPRKSYYLNSKRI